MKKRFLILVTGLLGIYLASCNGGGNPPNPNPDSTHTTTVAVDSDTSCEGMDDVDICADAGGIANFVIKSGDAITMITDFESKFKKDNTGKNIKAFEPAYWLDACTIFGIETYLKTQKTPAGKLKYDGVRIYMACAEQPDPVAYPGEQYQQKTTIFIIPTMTRVAAPPTSVHGDDPAAKITFPGCPVPSPFLESYNTAKLKIVAFDNVYRHAKTPLKLNDSLSKAIWIDSCVIFTLAKILRLPKANLDGANINMATYTKITTPATAPRGKFKEIQSTIIIVPTSNHQDNWKIIDCLFDHIQKMHWAPPGGFNHGELCPQECN